MLSHNTIALNMSSLCQSAAGSYHYLAAMDCRASLLYPHQLLDECRCSESSSVTALLGIILLRGYSVLVYRRGGPDDQARLHWLKITSGGVIASGLVGRSIIPLLAPSDVPP